MTTTTDPLSDWHEVGEFEIETGTAPDESVIVPIRLARDDTGGFQVMVADDAAAIERLDSARRVVDYFANYGAPHLIDLHTALNGVDGFDDICRLVEQRLAGR